MIYGSAVNLVCNIVNEYIQIRIPAKMVSLGLIRFIENLEEKYRNINLFPSVALFIVPMTKHNKGEVFF